MDEILTYADQIAQGLQAAHDKGIVHRDIKSSNVMVTEKGQVKIMDFGVAKFAGVAGPTTHGSTVGTMGYMSPEQIQGQAVDHRSDLWSFGVLLYEMLTGQLPFTGEYEAAIIYEILSEEPKAIQFYRQDVPNNITALLSRLLQRDLVKRVSSAKEIIENLNVKTVKETPEDDNKSTKTGWIKWAAMVSVIVVTGALIVQFFSPKKQIPRDISATPGMTENTTPLPQDPRESKPADQSPNQATTAKTEMSRAKKAATLVTADRLAKKSLAAPEINKKTTLSLPSQEQLAGTTDVFKETGQLNTAPAQETTVSSEAYATEAKALQDSLQRIKTKLDDEYIFLAEYQQAVGAESSGDALFKNGDHIGAVRSYQKAAQLYEAVTRVRERQVGQVQAVIETYEKALENKDLRLLKSLYVNFTQKMQTEWARVFKTTDDIEAQLSIEELAFQKEKVTTSVAVRLKYSGFVDSDNRFMWKIQLVETSSGWLIANISQNQ